MPGTPIVTKTGPRTYKLAEAVLGGHLVEGRPEGRVGLAAAESTYVLGVALADAVPVEQLNLSPTVVGGRPLLDAAPLPTSVAVAYGGAEVPVEYAAAADFGQLLVAASGGRVTPAGDSPDVHTIVGRCTEPDGVTAAGSYGLVRLGV